MDDDRIRLMGLIVRTHRRLTDSLGRELEQNIGIPLVFFDVLIHVGAAPDRRLTMSRLSTDVALTTGGVTRLVDRMAEAGLVARENCPSDRRSIYVVLTPEGQAVLDRAVAEHIEGIDRHLVAHLSDGDRAAPGGGAPQGPRRRLLTTSAPPFSSRRRSTAKLRAWTQGRRTWSAGFSVVPAFR